jgi:hypothetical protein
MYIKVHNSLLADYCPCSIRPLTTKSKLHFTNSLAAFFSEPCPVEIPSIPRSKSHIHFPLPRSFQSIRLDPRPCVTFYNKLFFMVTKY